MRPLAVILAAGAVLAGGAPAQPPKGKVKGGGLALTRYVKDTHGAAVVFYPPKLTKSAAAVGLKLDDAWKAFKDDTGLDARLVARVEVLVEPFPHAKSLLDWAAAVRFTGPVADKQVRAVLAVPPDAKARPIVNLPWYESPRYKSGAGATDYWAAFLTDPATAVFTAGRNMPGLAVPTDKVLPLAQAAETVDLTAHDLTVVAVPDVFLKRSERFFLGRKDATFEPARPALGRVKSVVATLDLARDPFLKAEFRADGPDGAMAAAELLRKGLAELKAVGADAAVKELELPPEFHPAAKAALTALATRYVITVEGGTAVLTVPRPPEFEPKKK
jgi:hypothetical protein